MNIVSRGPKTWPYAQNSAQDSVGKLLGTLQSGLLGDIFCWEAKGEARRVFEGGLKTAILDYLREHSDKAQESGSYLSIPIFMVGKRPKRAKPLVMFVSDDKVARKEAFDLIVKSDIMTKYPGFELGQSNFEKLMAWASETVSVFSAQHEEASDCCRLISHSSSGSEQSTRIATAGGAVSYQGKYMLLTVNHFLKESQPVESGEREAEASQISDCEITGDYDDDDDDDDDADTIFVETTRRGSVSDASESKGSEYGTSDSPFSIPEDNKTTWSSPEIQPLSLDGPSTNEGKAILCQEELDYAFIELNADSPLSAVLENAIPLDDLDKIEHHPRCAIVKTATPNGGTVHGVLSEDTLTVRLPHSNEFVEVYTARFPGSLGPGDCGSWVRDETTGRLFGHVFAGNISNGLTAIMPAKLVFEHARAQLDQLAEKSREVEAYQEARYHAYYQAPELDEIKPDSPYSTANRLSYFDFENLMSLSSSDDEEEFGRPVIYAQRRQPTHSVVSRPISTSTVASASTSISLSTSISTSATTTVSSYPYVRNDTSRFPSITSRLGRRTSKVFCTLCNDQPGGFRGEHELRRHMYRHEDAMRSGDVRTKKRFICRDPTSAGVETDGHVIRPLSSCEACQSQKHYDTYYQAAAHLRRSHFRSKSIPGKGRLHDRGWPPAHELKDWSDATPAIRNEANSSKPYGIGTSAESCSFDTEDSDHSSQHGGYSHSLPQQDAGQWLLDAEKLQQEWQSTSDQMLWIRGKPGAGKTIPFDTLHRDDDDLAPLTSLGQEASMNSPEAAGRNMRQNSTPATCIDCFNTLRGHKDPRLCDDCLFVSKYIDSIDVPGDTIESSLVDAFYNKLLSEHPLKVEPVGMPFGKDGTSRINTHGMDTANGEYPSETGHAEGEEHTEESVMSDNVQDAVVPVSSPEELSASFEVDDSSRLANRGLSSSLDCEEQSGQVVGSSGPAADIDRDDADQGLGQLKDNSGILPLPCSGGSRYEGEVKTSPVCSHVESSTPEGSEHTGCENNELTRRKGKKKII